MKDPRSDAPPLTAERHPILGQLVIGHAPLLDRQRNVTATRLALHPVALPPDVAPGDAARGLLALLDEAWPGSAGRLGLGIFDEALLGAALEQPMPPHLMVEVPAFLAVEPARAEALAARHRAGAALLLTGRANAPLPAALLESFTYSVIDAAVDRRDGKETPGDWPRRLPHVQSGVDSPAGVDAAFQRGAAAVLGWPFGDAPAAVPGGRREPVRPEFRTIVELLQRVDRGDSVDRLEVPLKNDPTLAFRLLRYINAPAFGLTVEITSFRHAIMLLGLSKLKRWLSLLLVSAGRDVAARPLAHAAVRRALLMERLGREVGQDAETCGELFVTGVFSLLDRLLGQPFDALLATVPASEAMRAALVDDAGPHRPHLALARAVEAGTRADIGEAAEALMIGRGPLNRALLDALVAARQLD